MLTAIPASAVDGLLLPTLGGGESVHRVHAECTPTAGVATNLNQISYAIAATATWHSANRSIPTGTSVRCYAYRVSNNHIYRSIAGGEPLAEAAAAGVIAVNDDGTASWSNCPF